MVLKYKGKKIANPSNIINHAHNFVKILIELIEFHDWTTKEWQMIVLSNKVRFQSVILQYHTK